MTVMVPYLLTVIGPSLEIQ